MPHRTRAVTAALLAKGFLQIGSKHRRYRYHTLDGVRTGVHTVMSHGSRREIDDSLLAAMARQVRLSRREFDELVRCPMSQSRYEGLLARRGHLPGQA